MTSLQIAEKLHGNGYNPVPVQKGEKRPLLNDWRNAPYKPDLFNDTSVGVNTEGLCVIDIDVLPAKVSNEIYEVAVRLLGHAPTRWGKAKTHKRAMFFQASESLRKASTKKYDIVDNITGEITTAQVEVLAEGQQCLVYGEHPDGGTYRFEDAKLWDQPRDALPSVSPSELRTFLAAAENILAAHAHPAPSNVIPLSQHADFPADVEGDTRKFKEALAAYDVTDYDDWIQVGIVAFNTFDEEHGFRLWTDWSSDYAGYDEDECIGKWHSFGRTGTGTKGLGSMITEARSRGVEVVTTRTPSVERIQLGGRDVDDFTLAELFVNRHKDAVRISGPKRNWYLFNGAVWEQDGCNLSGTYVRKHIQEVTADSYTHTKARLFAVRDVITTYPELMVPTTAWDEDGSMMNTPDGLVSLDKGDIQPHSPTQLVTKMAGCAPQAGPTPMFDKFLADTFSNADWGDDAEEVRRFITDVMALCLSGRQLVQRFFFLHGQGRNGKSVLLELIDKLMGDYSVTVSSSTLMTARSGGNTTELFQFEGARVALSSEIGKNDRWNAPLIKQITGDPKMTVKALYKDPYTINLQATLLIAGNSKPNFHGNDGGMARRMILIPFHSVVAEEDVVEGLAEKMFEAEGPAIMAKLVEAVQRLHGGASFNIPSVIRLASDEYIDTNNDMVGFSETYIVEDPEGAVRSQDLFEAFKQYKADQNEMAGTQKNFIEEFKTHTKLKPAVIRFNKQQARGFRGVRLRRQEDL